MFDGTKFVLVAFSVLNLVTICAGTNTTRPVNVVQDLLKKMRKQSSSSPTADFLKHLNPALYQQALRNGELPDKQLRSRTLAGGGTQDIEFLNFEQQPCKLRPSTYFLKQPHVNDDHFVWPFAIKIPRCSGSCFGHPALLVCKGIQQVTMNVSGFKIYYGGARKKREVMDTFLSNPHHYISKRSGSNYIAEHNETIAYDTTCGPKCRETDASCAARGKVLNNDYCTCECGSVKRCSDPFEWDKNKCQCVCSFDQASSMLGCFNRYGTSKIWNHAKCACECSNLATGCRYQGQTFDTTTCGCSCNLTSSSCPRGTKLNIRKCKCRSRQRRPRPRRPRQRG